MYTSIHHRVSWLVAAGLVASCTGVEEAMVLHANTPSADAKGGEEAHSTTIEQPVNGPSADAEDGGFELVEAPPPDAKLKEKGALAEGASISVMNRLPKECLDLLSALDTIKKQFPGQELLSALRVIDQFSKQGLQSALSTINQFSKQRLQSALSTIDQLSKQGLHSASSAISGIERQLPRERLQKILGAMRSVREQLGDASVGLSERFGALNTLLQQTINMHCGSANKALPLSILLPGNPEDKECKNAMGRVKSGVQEVVCELTQSPKQDPKQIEEIVEKFMQSAEKDPNDAITRLINVLQATTLLAAEPNPNSDVEKILTEIIQALHKYYSPE